MRIRTFGSRNLAVVVNSETGVLIYYSLRAIALAFAPLILVIAARYRACIRSAHHALIFQSRFWHRHRFQKPLDDVLGFDAFRLGMEVRQNTMAEDRIGQRLNVFDSDIVTAMNERPRFSSENQELRSAEAG